MATVKELWMDINPGGSPDRTGHRLYMEESPNPVTVDSPSWDLGNDLSIDLSKLGGMTSKSGTYNFGLTTIDGVGNESSMIVVEGVVIDFVAPDPPIGFSFRRE